MHFVLDFPGAGMGDEAEAFVGAFICELDWLPVEFEAGEGLDYLILVIVVAFQNGVPSYPESCVLDVAAEGGRTI